MTKKQSKTSSLNQQQKESLLHSVIRFLDKNGYSKSLKRALSEDQIPNEDWKSCSLDLEDVYCKYLDAIDLAESEFNTSKEQGGDIVDASNEFSKKKKKNFEKSGDKFSSQKSMKKNGSADVFVFPKTINAFQRVKVDEVEFAHEKLQDNSYRAKDGAEIGYGAKAQEILGQVRGRDFRHEKTKKKRGS